MYKNIKTQEYKNMLTNVSVSKLFLCFYILVFLFLPQRADAQVIAIGVEERNWVIDAETALQGITFSNLGERVRLAVLPNTAASSDTIELTTFASQYFVYGEGTRRITPIYRVTARLQNSAAQFPVEIRYPEEELGKQGVWVWGDDEVWREIPSENAVDKSKMLVSIPAGTTYFAVFSDDRVLEVGVASWYNYKNCHCAASPDYPKGTKLKVTNIKTGDAVEVVVNDFGPDRSQHPDRVIDLDRAAFEHLANPRVGLIRVKVEKIG